MSELSGKSNDTTRAQILRAASHEFAAKAYSSVSLDDILAAAGVTKGAMYFHFRSKHALAEAIMDGAETYQNWTTVVAGQAHKAAEEGDLRDGVDPDVVGETIIAILLGVEQLSTALSGGTDMLARLSRAWQMLLPSIADENSLEYFQQYLSRESVRFNQTDPPAN